MIDPVQVERDGAIATVVLNAPDKLNALSKASWTELGRVMRELSDDESLRCVSVRGAARQVRRRRHRRLPAVRANAAQGKEYGELIHATMRWIGECRHPTLAMIHGVCVGGGLEVARDVATCASAAPAAVSASRSIASA
jgi:enoyl-CoA hydratase/carnithine racemase